MLAKLREIFIATRPWSFVMTVLSLTFGILLAYYDGLRVSWTLSLLAVVGSVFLHAAVNVWNDYYDYKYGFDSPASGTAIYRPHPLIQGFMTASQVMILATSSAVVGLVLGALIAFEGRPLAVLLGLIGAALAFFYTGPPIKYKYRGLGEIGVFTAWGPLMVLGAYYVASGALSWKPVVASIPLGLLVAAVLLANNIRDIDVDKASGARTLAVRLGRERAVKLYKILILLPFVLIPAYVATKILPLESLLSVIAVLQAPSLIRMFDHGSPPDADPRTAKLLQNFATLLIVGMVLSFVL
jgi:1,4-dihydroxy-2-naphthoate octaprenyltransferase